MGESMMGSFGGGVARLGRETSYCRSATTAALAKLDNIWGSGKRAGLLECIATGQSTHASGQ